MSQQVPNIQDCFNNGILQNTAECFQELRFGDILAALIAALPATEAAAAVASNQKTLANPASVLLDINVTAGGATGRITKLFKTSTALVPTFPLSTHQAVWDGVSLVAFANGDAVTAADFRYIRVSPSNVLLPSMQRTPGERD
jgi:hypothetical protein